MNGPEQILSLAPVLQWGFAGFALILLGVLVWVIRALLGVLQSTGDVIGGNTQALNHNTELVEQVRDTAGDLRDRVLQFKCPFRGENAP